MNTKIHSHMQDYSFSRAVIFQGKQSVQYVYVKIVTL